MVTTTTTLIGTLSTLDEKWGSVRTEEAQRAIAEGGTSWAQKHQSQSVCKVSQGTPSSNHANPTIWRPIKATVVTPVKLP